jgi:hypothetical protein
MISVAFDGAFQTTYNPRFTLGPQKPEPEEPPETILVREGRAAMWADHSALWRLKGPWRSLGIAPFPVDGPQSRSLLCLLPLPLVG